MGKKNKPEKYEIVEKEDADGKIIIEAESPTEVVDATELLTNTLTEELAKAKKEAKTVMYQYTVKLGNGDVFIICSKHLLKETKDKIWVKDCFQEEELRDSFLGFDIEVAYKRNIGHYEWDSNTEWTAYLEVIQIPEWVSMSKEEAEIQLTEKKNQLIAKIDAMQKEGKIKIQKK